MQAYHQYTLDNFISLRCYEGGLAPAQILCMFNHIVEEKNNDLRFQAALRGIKLEDENKGNESYNNNPHSQTQEPLVPLFKDPEAYSDMSSEEREELTQNMMKRHKNWVATRGSAI